jgi:hypothetical protein
MRRAEEGREERSEGDSMVERKDADATWRGKGGFHPRSEECGQAE